MVKKYAIIVAGGKGERMNTALPKQFLTISEIPVLMHSMQAFFEYSPTVDIVVVLPEDQIRLWNNLCDKHTFEIPHTIIAGGKTRFSSVKNGLKLVGDDGFVAIHDGVRPVIKPILIKACYEHAKQFGNAIPVIEVNESVRLVNDENTENKKIKRDRVKICQTPQIFRCADIKKAYQQSYKDIFTDDAAVLESAGHKIHLIPGSPTNIKITTPLDLNIAEIIISQNRPLLSN